MLIQHIVLYFEACSNSVYPMHSGERYRTNGPLVVYFNIYFSVEQSVDGQFCHILPGI